MKTGIGYVSCFLSTFFAIARWPDPWLALCCGTSIGLTVAMTAEIFYKERK